MDLGVKLLPAIVFLGGLFFFILKQQLFFLYLGMFLFGMSLLINILYSYPNYDFAGLNIRALLKKIKVSAVNPVPCKVKGKIIGRGIPGLIFSEDFVLQDKTGIIFLDYTQPLTVLNFLFGLLRAKDYINEDVEIAGWYRRAPVPYIEIKKIIIGQRESVCYVYHSKLFVAGLFIIIGLIMCLSILS